MREADALEELWKTKATSRRLANLRRGRSNSSKLTTPADSRNSDDRRMDDNPNMNSDVVHAHSNLRGEPIRQMLSSLEWVVKISIVKRTIWRLRPVGRRPGSEQHRGKLTLGLRRSTQPTKTFAAATASGADFRPTPYDVWSFRHDRAFGIPHPGAIPPAIIAHTLHYYTLPNALVVDPMAGGGTVLDVCQSMGRRCFAYDLQPTRSDVRLHDIRYGFPSEAAGCDLIFCDPPYHTMLARQYSTNGIANAPLPKWVAFLHDLARNAFATLKPGGCLALLLAAQTEKDLPAGFGYLDHAFFGYIAGLRAGFLPERRISCPMAGAYLPQHVLRARNEGRLLGQVRDLLVMRKTSQAREICPMDFLLMQYPLIADP